MKGLYKILNCFAITDHFRSQNKLWNNFCFRDCIPKELAPGVVYRLLLGLLRWTCFIKVKNQNYKSLKIKDIVNSTCIPSEYYIIYLSPRLGWGNLTMASLGNLDKYSLSFYLPMAQFQCLMVIWRDGYLSTLYYSCIFA